MRSIALTSSALSTNSSELTLENASSVAIEVMQGLMKGLGWHNLSSSIQQADGEQKLADQKLATAVKFYLEEQDEHSHSRLITALNETLQTAQFEYNHAVKKQKYYQEQAKIEAEQKSTSTSNYIGQWSHWIYDGLQNFFGSTTEQQIEKYQKIAEDRQAQIETLSHTLQTLQINEYDDNEPTDSQSTAISPAHFPEIIQLGSLNGIQGFKLNGENFSDYSGYSVSAAGDVNSDGQDDLIIGVFGYGDTSGRLKGRSYVVFGGPEVGGSGILNLSSLTGVNGFKLDGEYNFDCSGTSVSAAGDINGDGQDDLIIGADCYPSGDSRGRSYVVFGGSGVGRSGILNLSNLTGVNGFKLDGEYSGDSSGISVRAAGDINGDRQDDLIIGAYRYRTQNNRGRSYVVFGGPGVGDSGVLSLSSLTGVNGFKLEGEDNGDFSGYSVSAAGDINGDGQDDLIIGAYGYPSGICKGRSYVLFGGPGVGNGGILNLSSLTGVNGFKLDAENNYDSSSGYSVNRAGDINGDGQDDLIIGAYGSGGKGCSYVVFGGPGVGGNGILNFSGLTGGNGFKLDGENIGDQSGGSVSAAGDINGDGQGDLIIGAQNSNNGKGRSYVVFGGPGVGSSGILNLSSLTGANGFKLDGEKNYDYSGYSVNAAGDINDDGVADLVIGTYWFNYLGGVGHSYVVFGDISPVVVNNSLSLNRGAKTTLTPTDLAAFDKNHDNSSLLFIITNITHGYFQHSHQPGIALMNFTQQQITNQQVQFVHDGSLDSPTYNITVRSAGIAWAGPSAAIVNFNPIPIILVNNQLVIDQNQTVQLSSENLLAACNNIADPDLEFTITNVIHGSFIIEGEIWQSPIVSFPQKTINSKAVSFMHDGGSYAPEYRVSVSDAWIQTDLSSANITFFLKPVFAVNQFLVALGQSTVLSLNNLCANNCYDDDFDELQFNLVGSVTSGQFENISAPGTVLTRFTQKNVKQNQVKFASNGLLQAPRYTLSVTDPISWLSTSSMGSTLLVTRNYLPINQDQIFYLSTNNLNITSSSGLDADIIFTPVENTLQHGYFSVVSNPSVPIATFKQDQINKNQITFVPDGSSSDPSCILAVRDGQSQGASGSFPCQIDFASYPRLDHAFLKINPPDSIQLNINNLEATDAKVSPSQLYFVVSEVKNDHFAYSSDFKKPITNFTQAEVSAGKVYFIANSNNPPSFAVSVWNGRLFCQEDCPRTATVVAPDVEGGNSMSSLLIGLLSSFGTLVLLPLAKWYFEKAVKSYFSSREDTADSQVTNAALARLWIGCCGVITHRQHEEYIAAFGHVIDQLSDSKQQFSLRKEWNHLSDRQKTEIKSTIAEESEKALVGEQSGLYRFFKSFCHSEATPQNIEAKAERIATKVRPCLSQLFVQPMVKTLRSVVSDDSVKTPLLTDSDGSIPLSTYQIT